MKRIRIAFVDFWSGFNPEGFILTHAMSAHHEVEIIDEPDKADYVIFSAFGDRHWSLPQHIIKIFYTGENICPDFNACDYAFGFERLSFGDRYMRLPNYYCTKHFQDTTKVMELYKDSRCDDSVDLVNRKFCCQVVSQVSGNPMRLNIHQKLSEYKMVDNGGRWNNNVGGPVQDKLKFQSQYKFCIAAENATHEGYTTEKIVEAFASKCIPIYWGDPKIAEAFNPKAFIDFTHCSSIEEKINDIIRLDNDDEAYLKMLNEPIFVNEDDALLENKFAQVVQFVDHILSMPESKANRYGRDEWGTKYINNQLTRLSLERNKRTSLSEKIRNLLRK